MTAPACGAVAVVEWEGRLRVVSCEGDHAPVDVHVFTLGVVPDGARTVLPDDGRPYRLRWADDR